MAAYIGKSTATREVLAILRAGLEHRIPVVLKGKPGIGKTELIKSIAKATGYDLHILLGSTMDPTDLNGLPALSHWDYTDEQGQVATVPVTTYALNKWAKDLLTKRRVVLFLDELNNAVPAVQSVLLSVVQDRRIGDIQLPEEVWIIAAMNAAEDAADGWTLAPPMANRFLHIDYEIDAQDWIDGMLQNWGKDAPSPGPALEKYMKLSAQRAEVAGFISQNKEILVAMPDSRDEAGEAWPSPRSWDNVSRILSSIPKSEATLPIRRRAVEGLVGEAAAAAYMTYEAELRLPDYEVVLNAPQTVKWNDLSTAEVKLTLDMVVNRITPETFERSLDSLNYYIENQPRTEIVASMLQPIGEMIRGKGKNPETEILLYQTKIMRPASEILRQSGQRIRASR